MFYQNHSLVFYTVQTFCNLILKRIELRLQKSWTVLLGSDKLYDILDLDWKKT